MFTESGEEIGKVKDLIVNTDYIRPKVVGICIKNNEDFINLDFSFVSISKQDKEYVLNCTQQMPFKLEDDHHFKLCQYVLDKKIVDISGKKVVRVNDIRLAILGDSTYVVAVDVGVEGLLRRIGLAKPIRKIVKRIGFSLPNHYILWDDVESVDFTHAKLRLGKAASSLEKLHPADLADIIEDMDFNSRMKIFESLDDEKAADVLEELEPEAQLHMIENLPVEKAADLLEKMPADEVADILDEMHEAVAEALLNEMEFEASDEIRELMEYPDHVIGSMMSTDFISFQSHNTIDDIIKELRQLKPDPDSIYYLYVVDDIGRLLSTVPIRDLIISEPHVRLSEIIKEDVVFVYDTDKLDTVEEILTKYNLLAIPVVDSLKVLRGIVVINDILEAQKPKRKR